MGKSCLKYSGSQSGYECTVPEKKDIKDDMGILLF